MRRLLQVNCALWLLAIFLGSCSVFNWDRDTEQQGIPFKKLRCVEPSGIYIGFTDQNFRVDSFEVEKGWVHFHANWKLRVFQTAEPVPLNSFVFPEQTWLFLDTLGFITSCVFPEDQLVQEYICRGGGGIKGISTGFYPSGRLKSFYPAENILADNIPCSKTVFFPVTLYENGQLKSCRLSADYSRDGKTYSKGTGIEITPDGTIRIVKP